MLSKILILKMVMDKILSSKDLAADFRETPHEFLQNPHEQ
jgi:hypothetical protein